MVSYDLRYMKRDKSFVLILVVVEDGLIPHSNVCSSNSRRVLILVVVDDGLVLDLIRLY